MGSGPKPPAQQQISPPARAPRAGDPGESGTTQRRTRLRALSRLGPRASVIAGETGGFQPASNVARPGASVLGG